MGKAGSEGDCANSQRRTEATNGHNVIQNYGSEVHVKWATIASAEELEALRTGQFDALASARKQKNSAANNEMFDKIFGSDAVDNNLFGCYAANNDMFDSMFGNSATNNIMLGRHATKNYLFRRYAANNDEFGSVFRSGVTNNIVFGREDANNSLLGRYTVNKRGRASTTT
jgi:hypothetical protein